MTTKKQRREIVEEKRLMRQKAELIEGLAAQKVDREKRERKVQDAERAVQSKKTALAMRKQHEASQNA